MDDTDISEEIPQNLGLDIIMDIHEHCLKMSNTNPGDVDQPMVGTTHTLSTCWEHPHLHMDFSPTFSGFRRLVSFFPRSQLE